MYIKKKMRTRLILLVIVVFAFVYWRGIKQSTAKQGLDCDYHLVYAVCTAKGKTSAMPGFFDVLKAGVKF